MSADEEARLVERANRGDAEAVAALYRLHRNWVVALAHHLTGSAEDAGDIAQETFLYLFARLPLTLTTSLRGYLYPVVKHQAVSLGRKRRPQVPLEPDELPWHGAAPDGDFARLVGDLPPAQREVVRLRFGLDFSLEEIAEALAIPLGTVKSRLHTALKSLRERVE